MKVHFSNVFEKDILVICTQMETQRLVVSRKHDRDCVANFSQTLSLLIGSAVPF